MLADCRHLEWTSNRKSVRNQKVDFNGAAIIDDEGRETPITEAMIQRALNSLADWPSLLGGPFAHK